MTYNTYGVTHMPRYGLGTLSTPESEGTFP
jgi:hypothetical protein